VIRKRDRTRDGFLEMIQKTSADVRRRSSEIHQIGRAPDFEGSALGLAAH
jgi:hypothetical protein